MATVTLPWNDGSGQFLTATFSGSGNGIITLSTPSNAGSNPRSLTLNIHTLDNLISRSVVVTQAADVNYLMTSTGDIVIDSQGNEIICQKVS